MRSVKNFINNMIINRYDPITKLYARNSFYYVTDKMLKKYCNEKFIIINIDVLNFKVINELYGNSEGDLLLRYIGNNIKKFFKKYNKVTYCREQSDIFFICFKYEEQRVKDFIEYMKNIFKKAELNLPIEIYFGVKIVIENERNKENIPHLCNSAKLALESIKGNYIDFVAYFNEGMKIEFNKKISIINDMHKALNENQFELYLQPKFDLITNCCVGAEALVRWNHPQKGFVFPSDFIPVFEENGFIIKLDEYMFEKSCMIIKKWIDEDKDIVPISVNISQESMQNELLYDKLINLIEKYSIPVEFLELEITETVYVDNQKKIQEKIKKLQDYGFKILMDDFGSGYSSLSSLSDLPVDVLKMDLKFLNNLTETSRGRSIIYMVVNMAQSLGLEIIAEGIETKNHVKFLQNVGCLVGQGYHYSKPIKIDEFENRFLENKYENDTEDNKNINNNKNIVQDNIPWDINKLGKENNVLFEALSQCNICVWEYDIVNERIIQTLASRKVHNYNKIIEDVPNSLVKCGHVHQDSIKEFENMYSLLKTGIKEVGCIVKVRKPNGSYWWEKINYITFFDENKKPVRALGISRDVTKMMANKLDKNKELLKIAYKDELTDIGNKKSCFNYINELINNNCSFCISFIEIDDLKYIKDKYHYIKGDEYIKTVVDIIKTFIRGDEEIFRIGKNEFIYIDKNSNTQLIDERLSLLNLNIKSLNLPYNRSISYGTIYVKSYTNLTCEEIISKANEKMSKQLLNQ